MWSGGGGKIVGHEELFPVQVIETNTLCTPLMPGIRIDRKYKLHLTTLCDSYISSYNTAIEMHLKLFQEGSQLIDIRLR